MSFSYQEGQVFSDKLTLLAPLQQDSLGETWLATDAERHARVSWRVFYQPLTPERQSALAQRINLVHPLIHSSIARTFELGREGETDYLVSEYHKGSAFDLNADLTSVWPLIQQLIAALIYAESLGFADGNLRPDRLLVSDEQILTIQFFGLDLPLDAEDPQMAYLSPNIQAGGVASPSDDVFSLGQLLCRLITGETHNPSSDPLSASLQSISVPKALVPLLASMLDPDPVRRPALRQVEEHLSTIMDPRQQQIIIEPGFQRPTLDEGASITQHTDGQTVSTRTAILGFGVILLTALLLFTLIPAPDIADPNSASPSSANPSSVPAKDALADHRQATGTSNYSDSPPEDEKLAPWEMAKTENAKHRGKTIAEDIIRLQLSLEEKGVQIWSPITYEESLNLAAKADDLYRSEAYVEALAGYEAAYTILSETITRLPAVLQNNLDLGTKALAEGDHEAAISAFTIVTTIEPENTVAQASLLRAENLQSVVALTTRAAALEYENQLEEALTL
ncbi:MAG: hypothetical protein OEZ23_05665, partial [Gammaproteobacteria bacterium]|nr:hypothetical protein [Gammaproteobacteria bacterium]